MKKMIVTFIHSNYCVVSAGTEKFERDYSALIQKEGYINTVFFSIATRGNRKIGKLVGLIINDKFIGIYFYRDIKKIILYITNKYSVILDSFSIQHLKNHNLDYIKSIIMDLQVPVNIFIHDHYSLCFNTRMINSQGNPCGFEKASNIKCQKCKFARRGIKHVRDIDMFYKDINDFIDYIIVPSEFVKEQFQKNYNYLGKKIIIRPHLISSGNKRYDIFDGKINIAYIGNQIRDKGYEEWKKLVNTLQNSSLDNYNFFYFGYGTEQIKNVKNIYVSNSDKNSKKMEDYLIENNISCALFWSHCGETYSYVYYELSLAGVYILTNTISGNVTVEVEKNKNGHIFRSLQECVDWLLHPQLVKDTINEYRIHPKFAPQNMKVNNELFIKERRNCLNINNKYLGKPRKRMLLTKVYLLKHLLLNRGKSKIEYCK